MSHLARLITGSRRVSPFKIGEPLAGGFYYGVMRYPDGDYAMIIAPKEAEALLAIKVSLTTTPGTDSTLDGMANSLAMNNVEHPAAQYCRSYRGGGFSDWFLASMDEAELQYRNLKPTQTNSNQQSGANSNSVPPGLAYKPGAPPKTDAILFAYGGAQQLGADTYHWSSTEIALDRYRAAVQHFSNGLQTRANKTNKFLVRPVRKIKITY